MDDAPTLTPDGTAVRVALWRAMHVLVDAPPHVLKDEIGLQLAAPDGGWRRRGDMDEHRTHRSRASIVARARFVEDLVEEEAAGGVKQYVILGAGLDSFAQRRPDVASGLKLFEIDRPGPQAWKRRRLIELGFGAPEWLNFVPVDFEGGANWWNEVVAAGFEVDKPAVVACAGVSMYLSHEAVLAMLRQIATLAPGSTLAMTFMAPLELVQPEERGARQGAEKGARSSGTPFISFFAPQEMLRLAKDAGFKSARHVSATDLTQRYFDGRPDGLRPSSSEEILVATT
jgi:methyltransferase (TIGR00027 family)